MRGSPMSRIARSGSAFASESHAVIPSSNDSVRYPSCRSAAQTASRIVGSSSTTVTSRELASATFRLYRNYRGSAPPHGRLCFDTIRRNRSRWRRGPAIARASTEGRRTSPVRTSAMARLLIMGVLMLGMLIPLGMIQSVVSERTTRRDAALREIGSTWGGFQTVGGPVLTVPYLHHWTDQDGVARHSQARAYFLPETLDVKGTIEPLVLGRGLFKVVVYRAHLTITGAFTRPDLTSVRPTPSQVQWDDATINLGIGDPRGVSKRLTVNWIGQELPLEPGAEDVAIFAAGLHARTPGLSSVAERTALRFAIEVDLNGSRDLRFLPTGSETSVQLTSAWPHPGFIGAPLPASREIAASGF